MKRIKKVSQTVPTYGQIVDGYSDSTTDGYSANYQNEHNIIVKSEQPTTNERVWFAKGKNLLNNIITFTKNGVTCSLNNDGTYTLNGTVSVSGAVEFRTQENFVKLKPGTYTGSTNVNESFYIRNQNGDYFELSNANTTSKTFTISQEFQFNRFYAYFNKGTVFDNVIFKPMLEKGNSVTTYEPYITPSINLDGDEIYNQNMSNYSTDEQRIGTWIDGKPIYRKVFSATSPSTESTSASQILTFDFSIDTLIKLEGNIYYNNTTWRDINSYQTDSLFSFVDVVATNKEIRQCVTGSAYLSKPEYIILEYTKTTD